MLYMLKLMLKDQEKILVALKKAFSRAVSKINGVNVESEFALKTIDKRLLIMMDLQHL